MNPADPSIQISVIIPVHDRRERLEACLRSLGQNRFEGGAEVIVLCDGGPESMREAAGAYEGPWPMRWIDQPKAGPAVARNRAVRESKGRILLFLNDDVVLEPQVLAEHVKVHGGRPGHAVMGNMRWSPEVITSPFMHWCAHHDHVHYMFNDHNALTWESLHTLNASIDRCWFEAGFWYDEEFPDPAFEDTEHAYRLWKAGMKVTFAPDAIAYHHHFFDPDGYLDKSYMRGKSGRRLLELYPEQTDRILTEYREAIRLAGGRLYARTLLGLPDGPGEWYARIAHAFLAGLEGRPVPWVARRCR